MATEVKHGPAPRWKATLQPGEYSATIVGHYTARPGLAAAGVTRVTWNSTRTVKRRAEALALRTAFLCWFVMTYERLGGSWTEAVRAVTDYPFRRLRRSMLKARRQKRRVM